MNRHGHLAGDIAGVNKNVQMNILTKYVDGVRRNWNIPQFPNLIARHREFRVLVRL
jgi:hypothetical protein